MHSLPLLRAVPLLVLRPLWLWRKPLGTPPSPLAPTTPTPLLSFLVYLAVLCLRDWLEFSGNADFSLYAVGSALWVPLFASWYFHAAASTTPHRQTHSTISDGVCLLLDLLSLHTLIYCVLLAIPIELQNNTLLWSLWAWKLTTLAVLFWQWHDGDFLAVRRGYALCLLAGLTPQIFLEDYLGRFWYPVEENDLATLPSPERLFSKQGEFSAQWSSLLTPGTPGIEDHYSISFGSHGAQNVFREEALYATEIFQGRFGTTHRAITLVNHPDTLDTLPLATQTNLYAALQIIGSKMNRDEDILYLYLTSHGSDQAEISVALGDLNFEPVNATTLRKALDDAGIQWRVLIISACYAGSFIKTLEDSHTLVMTAASASRTSFGCSNERHFTYFGEALLASQLNRGVTLLDAFKNARDLIEKRENAEELTPSQPQLWIGDAMTKKFAASKTPQIAGGFSSLPVKTPDCTSCDMAADSSTTNATANARSSERLK